MYFFNDKNKLFFFCVYLLRDHIYFYPFLTSENISNFQKTFLTKNVFYITYYKWKGTPGRQEPPVQGRIQDLSEGGGQDFLGTKKLIIRNKKSCRRRNFFLT